MARLEEIIKKAKIKCNDISGRRFTDDAWLSFLEDALIDLNSEFKLKFKEATLQVEALTPTPLPADFLVIKSVYVRHIQAEKTSYDRLLSEFRYLTGRRYYYAIEGSKIYTNFSGECTIVYYSSDITLDDVPKVFDSTIVDFLVWKFFEANYPELEEYYYSIYKRNRFKLRQDILNLETSEEI